MNEKIYQLHTPVALVLSNRTETLTRVIAAIKEARPKILYCFCDEGQTPADKARFAASKALVEKIDWCEVRTNYATEHMDVKRRLATGLQWIFENEERAIILEHDCLPNQSFFRFCEELLERYADDTRVMHIGGNNFQQNNKKFVCRESYYFSHIPHIWGWASWRRAWVHYDPDVQHWPEARKQQLTYNIFSDPAVAYRWEQRFQDYYEDRIRSWDGQWTFAVLSQGGLCINPCVNLVTNIGFGQEAVSAKNPNDPLANIPSESMMFPLKHPNFFVINQQAERYTSQYVFGIGRTHMQRFKWFLKWHYPRPYHWLKKLFGRYTSNL